VIFALALQFGCFDFMAVLILLPSIQGYTYFVRICTQYSADRYNTVISLESHNENI